MRRFAVAEYKDDDALTRVGYDRKPVLLLFGDNETGLGRAQAAAERALCRVEGLCSIREAEARLTRQVSARAAMVMADAPSQELDQLLVRLGAEGRAGRLRPIVVAPLSMIDGIALAGLGSEVDHLIDPTETELAVAVALAASPAPSRLHDVTRSPSAAMLQQLSEEAARLATMLASISSEEAGAVGGGGTLAQAREPGKTDPGFVRAMIRGRRLRDQYFRSELFPDPAWDMLLDLYAARLEGNRVAVSSLCIAAAVPATTALRWIKALTDHGLLVRAADPQDGRRVYIELSADAARAMGAYLDMAQRVSPTLV